ncbi:MAG: RIP metalloprotease RseP [Pikeienuella sp.]
MDPVAFAADLWNVLTYIPPFLVVLAVVVFVHEFGHYIVGRWCGIHAETFSIGFGKVIWSRVDSRGTCWQVAVLPLGGFVKFVGDMDPASAGQRDADELSEEERAVAFHTAPVGRRAATVAAGPVANFLLSIIVFAALALVVGKPSDVPVIGAVAEDAPADLGFVPGDRVLEVDGTTVASYRDLRRELFATDGAPTPARLERDGEIIDVMVHYSMPPVVTQIEPGDPASRAGILPGDRIVAINGRPVLSFYGLVIIMAEVPTDRDLTVTVERAGATRDFSLTPALVTREDPITGERRPLPTLGVGLSNSDISPTFEAAGPVEALEAGVTRTWEIIAGTVVFFGDMIFADADLSNIGGPIRIAEMAGDQADRGMLEFIHLIAVLSTAIGLLNLFPIPVLDGGHLMFYGIEAVRGRPVGGAAIKVGTVIGLSLVLSLMVFATYNDLTRVLAG